MSEKGLDIVDSRNRHQNNFDVIRLVAAMFVIVTHSYSLTGTSGHDFFSEITGGAMMLSHMGVAIFFTISGYLISQSALSSKSWTGYLWRRILRIVPGLAVVVVLSAFLLGPLFTNLSLAHYFSTSETYKHLLNVTIYLSSYGLPGVFASNPVTSVNGSLWTLAYEFTLYFAVIPAVLFGLFKKRNLLIAIWIGMFLFRILLADRYFWYSYASPFTLNLNMMYLYEWSFYFLSGMVFFAFKDRHVANAKIAGLLVATYIIAALLEHTILLRSLNYVTIPYLVFYLSFIPGKLNKLGKIGDFSYGMYIYAFPAQQLIIHLSENMINVPTLILLSILCTLPFAVASWFLVEKRALMHRNLFD